MRTIKVNDLISFDIYSDGEILPSINTEKFIESTLDENGMANDLLRYARENGNDKLHWDGDCAEHLSKVTGLKVINQVNTYNYDNDLDSHAFLETSIGYFFRDKEENEAIEEAEPGYSNNPTSELLKNYKITVSEDGDLIALDENGEKFNGYAYHPAA